jgi:hypothetical protein
MSNIYDMADTWNDAGTAFTAIKMDVTDTASDASSLLMDLQVGGAKKTTVGKDGALAIYNTYTDASNYQRTALKETATGFVIDQQYAGTGIERSALFSVQSNGDEYISVDASRKVYFQTGLGNPHYLEFANQRNMVIGTFGQDQIQISNGLGLCIIGLNATNPRAYLSFGGNSVGQGKVNLYNRYDNTLRMLGSTGAENQQFMVYNTAHGYTDVEDDYERALLGWVSDVFTITTQQVGTGVAHNLEINSAADTIIDATGNVLVPNLPVADPVIAGALWVDGTTLKVSAG